MHKTIKIKVVFHKFHRTKRSVNLSEGLSKNRNAGYRAILRKCLYSRYTPIAAWVRIILDNHKKRKNALTEKQYLAVWNNASREIRRKSRRNLLVIRKAGTIKFLEYCNISCTPGKQVEPADKFGARPDVFIDTLVILNSPVREYNWVETPGVDGSCRKYTAGWPAAA